MHGQQNIKKKIAERIFAHVFIRESCYVL